MNILVTGGAGYVGSSLTPQLLEAGHRVRVLDNLSVGGSALLSTWAHPNFEFMWGDLREAGDLARAVDGMDAVVHLAAIVGDPACARDPELTRSVNAEGANNLLEACQAADVKRFVFASTCSNYGKMDDPEAFVNEESDLKPVSLYAETKVDFERSLLDPSQTGGLCATALRLSTVYGAAPRMRFDLTVNEFTAELREKRRLVVFGEQFWRPYVHVREASRAMCMVLDADEDAVRNQVFNVGTTSENYQKQTIVERIMHYLPGVEIEYVKKDEDPRDYRVSFQKIETELGFESTVTVDDGIREVLALLDDGVITDWDSEYYRN